MERDIRSGELYREVEAYFRAIHAPGDDCVSDAADACVEPNGQRVAVTGTVFTTLDSAPVTRICLVDVASGALTTVPSASNSDRLPRWSPDGRYLAFLSDRRARGIYQLWLRSMDSPGRTFATPPIDACVESLQWSPCGRYLLLCVAGLGAELAGCQGGASIVTKPDQLPQWMPSVDRGDAENLWRGIYVHDRLTATTRNVSRPKTNYWEASWLGSHRVIAVVSHSHGEGSWYRSTLICQDLNGGDAKLLLSPTDQIGVPAASPSGAWVSIVEAVCSDRLIVCGTLKLLDAVSGAVQILDTRGVEVTHGIWRDDQHLLFTGHRGIETVVGELSLGDGSVAVHWSGTERTAGAWYPSIWPFPEGGAVAVGESFDVAPELAHVRGGAYRVVKSFGTPASRAPNFNSSTAEPIDWRGRDGLELQGWLIRPQGDGPFPLVLDIHGGPVWQCRNRWAGRLRGAKVLADHGIASLYPNPRGSSGRGQAFARRIIGDMGGEDTFDYLTACDAMVDQQIADPRRLGVTGISYGGFASAWLITQDSRFAAAVPISPVTDWYSQHRTSQIPYFDALFLAGSAYEAAGQFFERSPVMHAAKVRTPTLQLTGGLDRNTPPSQAVEFHHSLLEHGVPSVLAVYPTAGHGIRSFPEVIDATARYVGWFLTYFSS